MARSPHSRGKGNRRLPGRPGGLGRRRPVGPWQHRAPHLVPAVTDLAQPVVHLDYHGRFGDKPMKAIYRFDQEMARLGKRYYAEFRRFWFHTAVFRVYVPEPDAPAVASAMARVSRA